MGISYLDLSLKWDFQQTSIQPGSTGQHSCWATQWEDCVQIVNWEVVHMFILFDCKNDSLWA